MSFEKLELVHNEKDKVYPYHLRYKGEMTTICGKLRSRKETGDVTGFIFRNGTYLICKECFGVYNLIKNL